MASSMASWYAFQFAFFQVQLNLERGGWTCLAPAYRIKMVRWSDPNVEPVVHLYFSLKEQWQKVTSWGGHCARCPLNFSVRAVVDAVH